MLAKPYERALVQRNPQSGFFAQNDCILKNTHCCRRPKVMIAAVESPAWKQSEALGQLSLEASALSA